MSTKALVVRDEKHDSIMLSIERADIAESTRSKYRRTMQAYLDTGADPYDAGQLADYAEGLSTSGRSFLSAVVKRYTEALKSHAKSIATPDNVAQVQAAVWRAEALQDAVKPGKTNGGQKTHTWLNQAQVRALLATCDDTLAGQRDKVALGLMLAAGLRRAEASALTFDDLVLQPVGDRIRATLAIEGKGAKNRSVPISDNLAAAIDAWGGRIGGTGRVLRSFDRRGDLRDSISDVALYNIVQAHGADIGKPKLAPHDLRRTYAQLGFEAGVPITQISRLLGHANIATTQRYLNLELNLESTASDFVPF